MVRNKFKIKKTKSPYLILLGGFALLIIIGAIFLVLPISHKSGTTLNFIDSLFLSTSAVCVTGLISTSYSLSEVLSPFGIIVLWFLIEIGGLGFITLVTFAFSFKKRKAGVSANALFKEALNQNSYQELIPLGKKIVITSFSIQGVAFILNFLALLQNYKPLDALWYSFFHTASSFNNAGFDIFGKDSLITLSSNIPLMIITGILITIGGFGFIVIFDIFKKKSYKNLNIHSKIVINTTIAILIIGTILIKLTNSNISIGQALLQVIFARTAGFYSLDLSSMRNAALIVIMIIMFIGGSPASIAGGIKTTTFYTIVRSVICFGKGKKHVIAHNREISEDSILKSYVLVTISICFITFMVLLIMFIEEKFNTDLANNPNLFTLRNIIFEAISAFATCGTTLSITPHLHTLSKICVILLMYFGRLGPITFISLLNKGGNNDEDDVQYVEGDIIIG